MTELLPCPFCGGLARWINARGNEKLAVQCDGCEAIGPIVKQGPWRSAAIDQPAIDAWNRRAPALENGPAVLADANTNPSSSDLSSLRKGAEDARSQAEMLLLAIMAGDPASELKLRVNDIIAALVSGSREDGA